MRTTFGVQAPTPTRSALSLYRVNYASKNASSSATTLSGLLALPQNGAPRGLVLWCHGTISDPAGAPSRWRPGRGGADQTALLALASGGYAIAMPDYPGFGADVSGAHPYPMGRPNALGSLDMIAPARAVANSERKAVAAPLFIGGYSQGGAVAMWAARILQERGTAPTRTAALSGPYDLTGATLDSLLVPARDDTGFAGQLFLVGLMGHGYAKGTPARYREIFKPAMALAVRSAFSKPQSETESVKGLIIAAKLLRAQKLEDVLNPRFFAAAKRRDISHPLVRRLRESDIVSWAPRGPLLLWTLENDTIVTAQNTRRALANFRARGIGADRVRAVFSVEPGATHTTSFKPAVLAMRKFFDGGFAALPQAR